jgi:BclB C-terminal domain-containing protein
LTSVAGGLAGIPAFIGFGTSGAGATALTGTIDLTGLSDFAFSVPRAGTISSISAYFSTAVALSLVGTIVTVQARLYASTPPTNVYTPIGPTVVLTPPLTGPLAAGVVSTGIATGLAIPVAPQTQLMMVFFIQTTGEVLIQTVVGFASAGLVIT